MMKLAYLTFFGAYMVSTASYAQDLTALAVGAWRVEMFSIQTKQASKTWSLCLRPNGTASGALNTLPLVGSYRSNNDNVFVSLSRDSIKTNFDLDLSIITTTEMTGNITVKSGDITTWYTAKTTRTANRCN